MRPVNCSLPLLSVTTVLSSATVSVPLAGRNTPSETFTRLILVPFSRCSSNWAPFSLSLWSTALTFLDVEVKKV